MALPNGEASEDAGASANADQDDLATEAGPDQSALEDVVESFDSYYQRDYRSLVGLAYVLTGAQWAAEDLVQDAMTEAHRRWGVVSSYDDPGAWVRRVLVNRSTSRFRKLTREARMLTKIGSRRVEIVQPAERSLEVWAAVRALPPRQAQAIALRYWEDRTTRQIASVLDCGEETVKTHLKRGRSTLATKLEGLSSEGRTSFGESDTGGADR